MNFITIMSFFDGVHGSLVEYLKNLKFYIDLNILVDKKKHFISQFWKCELGPSY